MLYMRLLRFLLDRWSSPRLRVFGAAALCVFCSSSCLWALVPRQLIAKPGYPVKLVHVSSGDYFADFGLDWFGKLQLRITSPAAGRSFTVLMGEKESPADHIDSHPGGCIAFYQTQIVLRRGLHLYDVALPRPDARRMPAYIGAVMPFRYVQIIGSPSKLIRRDVVQIRVHYPFSRHAALFTSSSDTLNAVWHLCHHSIEATSFCGIFADGNRERRPYEADDLIAELDWFTNTTDTTLPALTDRWKM